MIKILAHTTEFSGELKNFEDYGDDSIVFRFALGGDNALEVAYPLVPKDFMQTIKNATLSLLKDSIVDFNKKQITFNSVIQSDGQTMKKSEREKATRQKAKITRIL